MTTRAREVPDYVRRGSCGDCIKVWGQREVELLTQIDTMREALRAARPFIALEAGLANSGYGHPGNGEAPKVLAEIDALT